MSAYGAPQYTVTPLVIDEEVMPRDILTREITITNTGDAPVTIYPTVNAISLDEGGTIREFVPQVMGDQTQSITAWIEISRAGIDLFKGQSTKVPLTLRINPQAQPGEYHAFLGFPFGGNRDEAERKVRDGTAPGIVLTLSLDEQKTTALKLARFLVDRFVFRTENSAASFTVRNPGEVTLIPEGEVILYDAKGREVGSLPVNPDKVEIPPGGEHTFVGTVPLQGLFGKYKAFLDVEYGTALVASVQDTAFFYAVPIPFLLSLLGVLFFIVILVSWHIHRKYFDDEGDDGSDALHFHVRSTHSEPVHHDINLRS